MTSFPSPNIQFLCSFLSSQVSLASKENFQKAARCYVYLKAIYAQGGCTVKNSPYQIQFVSNSDSHLFSPKQFQNQCIQFIKKPDLNSSTQEFSFPASDNLMILKQFKVRDFFFSTAQDEQNWKKSFQTSYPNLSQNKIEELLNLCPFNKKSNARLIRLDFQKTLTEKQWIKSSSFSSQQGKRTGLYSKINQPELEEKISAYQEPDFLFIKRETGEIFPNEFISQLIREFSPPENSKILFESECLISDTSAELETILKTLAQNWFSQAQTQPVKLSYFNQETQRLETVITYPITFVYLKRTFYLYGIESHRNDWKAYRLDRIYSAEILDWNHLAVSETLKHLLDINDLPNIDEIRDELENNVLGYAFWNTPQILLLQFDKQHYYLHIKDNMRSQIFREINLNNFSKVFKQVGGIVPQKHKQEMQPKILQFLKISQTNSLVAPNSVFCLATFYEKDLAVRQRLLAWGKKVKVIFPESLQQEIFEELRFTVKLYDSHLS